MSNKLKRFFCGCGILMLLGLVLVIVGIASGGIKNIEKLDDKFSFISFGRVEEKTYELEAFNDVNIDYYDDNITFVEGSGFSVKVRYASGEMVPAVKVENGVLNISQNREEKFHGIMLGMFQDYNTNGMVVTYPTGHEFENLRMNIKNSDVDVKGIKSQKTEMTMYDSDIRVENSSLGATKVKIQDGTLEFWAVTTKAMDIIANASEVNLNGMFYGTNKISQEDRMMESEIHMENLLSLQEFKFDINILSGELEIDGKRMVEFEEERDTSYRYQSGNADATNSIIIDNFVGDVEIKFAR